MAREFILVDLATQMPFLPRYAQTWPRERLLAWLRVWGEVHDVQRSRGGREDEWPNRYTFRSWIGRWTWFTLTEDGQMYIPGTHVRAWPEQTP